MHSWIRLTMDCRTLLWVLGRLRMIWQPWDCVGELCLYFRLEPNAVGFFFQIFPQIRIHWVEVGRILGGWLNSKTTCLWTYVDINFFLVLVWGTQPWISSRHFRYTLYKSMFMCGHNASHNCIRPTTFAVDILTPSSSSIHLFRKCNTWTDLLSPDIALNAVYMRCATSHFAELTLSSVNLMKVIWVGSYLTLNTLSIAKKCPLIILCREVRT
jgi:hypothetical protein